MLKALEKDLKESNSIRKRREYEEQRRARIFNPKQRLIGIDTDYLAQQVAEKRAKEQEQQLQEEEYRKQKAREDVIVMAMDRKIEEEKLKIKQQIQEFRKNYQKFEDRREFDLNDPEYRKKILPMRMFDDDPRCSISSAQKFAGEDLSSKERLRIQAEQSKAWLQQQIQERHDAENERKQAEKLYQEALAARDKRAVELEKYEEETKKKLESAIARFNRAMADERRAKEQMQHCKDEEDKVAEKINWMTGDFLTENPAAAASSFGPHKFIPAQFKGQNPAEAIKCREENKQLMEDKKMRMLQEKSIDDAYEKMTSAFAREVIRRDLEIMEKQRAILREQKDINKTLMEDARKKKCEFDQARRECAPSEEYFGQFNSCTR